MLSYIYSALFVFLKIILQTDRHTECISYKFKNFWKNCDLGLNCKRGMYSLEMHLLALLIKMQSGPELYYFVLDVKVLFSL